MEETVLQGKKLTCYHCGDPCDPNDTIVHEDLLFCCTGCRSVYEILKEADLCDFYNLEEKVGRVISSDERKYIVLDNAEIASEFLEFENEGVARVTFFSPKIHCSSCIWLLEHLNRINSKVISSRVNFLKREVTVTFNSRELTLRDVADLLDQMGYAPKSRSVAQKKQVMRWSSNWL